MKSEIRNNLLVVCFAGIVFFYVFVLIRVLDGWILLYAGWDMTFLLGLMWRHKETKKKHGFVHGCASTYAICHCRSGDPTLGSCPHYSWFLQRARYMRTNRCRRISVTLQAEEKNIRKLKERFTTGVVRRNENGFPFNPNHFFPRRPKFFHR